MTDELKGNSKAARRRERRRRAAHRNHQIADLVATVWREEAAASRAELEALRVQSAQQTADIEWLMIDRWNMLHAPAGCISARDEVARLSLMRCEAEPQNEKAETTRFLGLNVSEWLGMPNDMLALFGLLGTVTRWRQQLAAAPETMPRRTDHRSIH